MGALEFAVSPLSSLLSSCTSFFLHMADNTTGNGVYLLNRSLMDGDGGLVGGVLYRVFSRLAIFLCARHGVKTHSFVFLFFFCCGVVYCYL